MESPVSVELDLGDVLTVLQHFLLEQRYIGALRALEQESGRVLGEGNAVSMFLSENSVGLRSGPPPPTPIPES